MLHQRRTRRGGRRVAALAWLCSVILLAFASTAGAEAEETEAVADATEAAGPDPSAALASKLEQIVSVLQTMQASTIELVQRVDERQAATEARMSELASQVAAVQQEVVVVVEEGEPPPSAPGEFRHKPSHHGAAKGVALDHTSFHSSIGHHHSHHRQEPEREDEDGQEVPRKEPQGQEQPELEPQPREQPQEEAPLEEAPREDATRKCEAFRVPAPARGIWPGRPSASEALLRGTPAQGSDKSALCNPEGLQDQELWLRGLSRKGAAVGPLSEAQLDRSVVSAGRGGRFGEFIDKLLAGRGVSVAILGGSITAEMKNPNANDIARSEEHGGWGVHSWGWKFFDWINHTFAHADNHYDNGAVPGTKSSYMEVCMAAHLSERARREADLVVLEYAVNDHPADPFAMERLIRKTLALPSRPAVVVLNACPWQKGWDLAGPLEAMHGQLKGHPAPRDMFDFRGGLQSSEYGYATLAQYYTLPVLSFYKATYIEAHHKVEGYLVPERKEEELEDKFFIQENLAHPNPRGQDMVAQMMVHLVQDEVVGRVLRPGEVQAQGVAGVDAQAGLRAGQEGMPRPLLKDNWGNESYGCWFGAHIEDLVVSNDGWAVTDDAKPHGAPKVGLTSLKLGEKLSLKVLDAVQSSQVDIILAFLMSYDVRMGMVRVRCNGGCGCGCDFSIPHTVWYCRDKKDSEGRFSEVDSIWVFETSQTQAVHFQTYPRQGAPAGEACFVDLENAPRHDDPSEDLKLPNNLDFGNPQHQEKAKEMRQKGTEAAQKGEVKVKLMSVMSSQARAGGKIGIMDQISTVIDVMVHD